MTQKQFEEYLEMERSKQAAEQPTLPWTEEWMKKYKPTDYAIQPLDVPKTLGKKSENTLLPRVPLGGQPPTLPKQYFKPLPGKMVSSIVDTDKSSNKNTQPVTTIPWLDLIDQQYNQSKQDIGRQQRRVAATGMMNSFGNLVKSLASAYGANKGAPISPVQGTADQNMARMDALWNQQMDLSQRYNSMKLQAMLNEYTQNRNNEEWWNRYYQQLSDEERNALRDYGFDMSKITGIGERDKALEDKKFQNDLEMFGHKSDFDREMAAAKSDKDRDNIKYRYDLQMRNQSAGIKQRSDEKQKEKAEEKNKPKLTFVGKDGKTVEIYDQQYNEILRQAGRQGWVLDKDDLGTTAKAEQVVRENYHRLFVPGEDGKLRAYKAPKYDPDTMDQVALKLYNDYPDPTTRVKKIRTALEQNSPDEFYGLTEEEKNQKAVEWINAYEETVNPKRKRNRR